VPWDPERFSAPALGRIWEDERRRRRRLVPFFPGLMSGETNALVDSFAGEPELHHPVRGRIKGVAAFERWVAETRDWMAAHAVAAADADAVITRDRGVEEVVLHVDGDAGRIALPVAIASDHEGGGGITEQRMYFATAPLSGRRAVRPPLLQPDAGVELPGAVGEHLRAVAAGDVEAALATFEPAGCVRDPAGGTHRGADELRALYERLFATGGGVVLEHCAGVDDGRACALEYNLVGRGGRALRPQAGVAVYERGDGGRLAAVRIYDDAGPPA
jgi:SnoaL-like domain